MTSAAQQRHREYIASPVWKHRRERFLRGRYRKCEACGTSFNIDVHHLTYDRAFTGEELDSDLMALCRPHHERAHVLYRSGHYSSIEAATRAMLAELGGGQHTVPWWVRVLRWLSQ